MKIVTRPHRAWYGRTRWRWYWQREDGSTISYSVKSYDSEQIAWETARDYFSAPLTIIFDNGDPDQRFELYAGPRDFRD